MNFAEARRPNGPNPLNPREELTRAPKHFPGASPRVLHLFRTDSSTIAARRNDFPIKIGAKPVPKNA